jgi:phosphoglycolate phosphatase
MADLLDTVAFDMDGTLLNSGDFGVRAIEAAFVELMDSGRLPGLHDLPGAEAIRAQIGKPPHVFYRSLLPEPLQERAAELHAAVTVHERRLLESGVGKLFDGTLDVLHELRARGLKLLLVSNCSPEYMDAVVEVFSLEQTFVFRSAAGRSPDVSKTGELGRGLEVAGTRRGVMVGDRYHDADAAKAHNLPFVGCTYGYGTEVELANADALIHDIRELPAALNVL